MTAAARPLRGPRALRGLLALLLAGLLAVLAGCARIPVEGPVREGDTAVSAEEQVTLYYPGSPVAGMSAEDIVRGFIRAGTGTADNYKVAREFLTPAASISWDSTATTLVVESDPVVSPEKDGVIKVEMNVVAQVDGDGRYTENAVPTKSVVEYVVEQVDGQWRVASAPGGIILLEQDFTNIFSPFSVSFLDASETFLVPEVRWFPSHATAPTRIVQALLRGPSAWLAEGGVKTAFPAGTQLLGPIMPELGQADANFSSAISSASGDAYSLMKLQLVESLAPFQTIDSVAMLVNGAKIDVDVPPAESVVAHSQVNSLPLVVRDGTLGYLSGDVVTPLPSADGLQTMLPTLHATAGAVSSRVGVAAFLTPEGVVAASFSGGEPVMIDTRPDLMPPTIGPWGFVWSLQNAAPGRAAPTAIHIGDPVFGTGTELPLPDLGGATIRRIALSRSGVELAIGMELGGKAYVAVMAVLRDTTTGRPMSLGAPQLLPVDATTAVDISWVDATTVALLASDAEGSTEVFVHQLGGTTTRYGGVENGVSIEGSNTRQGLRVCDREGNVYVPRATQWQASGAKVQFLVSQS
ncbi:Lipoprotein LpqB [Pseudoclavibacter triregionum]|nr:Lipoprotein LpqB [Pseudoclavibacter triregionum]